MPTVIGQEHAQRFDSEAYRKVVRENSGAELTTDGIISGIDQVVETFKSMPENPLDALKDSPYFIKGDK